MRRDIRYALRSLLKSPSFTLVALTTIALGIGINTAIFSVVHGVVLKPLAYPEPDQLVTVWEEHESGGGPATEWTGRSIFSDWRRHNRTFEAMAAVNGWGPTLRGSDSNDVLNGAVVSPGYFAVMGIQPAHGRSFRLEEEVPGEDNVVVLSHELWQRRFAGDTDLLGKPLTLDGQPYTVVGILPPGFRGPLGSNAEIWSALAIDTSRSDHGNAYLRVVARLSPGVTPEAADADMKRVAAAISEAHPTYYRDVGATVVPLLDTVVGAARTPLFVLLGAVGLILLIACTNVANLLLARASARRREMAVRVALGASRGKLLRQLLTESVMLGMAGGALGLLLAVWGTQVLVQMAPAGTPRIEEVGIHPVVLLFAVVISVGSGVLFGLTPALRLSGAANTQALTHRGGDDGGKGGARLRGALVVAQLAMGMAVLASAGLLLRSFAELRSVDPGFRTANAVSARLFFPAQRFADAGSIHSYIQRLEEEVRAEPGVRSVGSVSVLPLSGAVNDISFGIEGRIPPQGQEPIADLQRATPGAREALGLRLQRGRFFEDADRADAAPVAVVSERMVRRHFGSEDPLGQRIKVGGVHRPDAPWYTIVGVVQSVRSRALATQPPPEIYLPAAQRASRGWTVVVRTNGDPAAFVPVLRDKVRSLDSDMAVSQVATLEDLFSASLAVQRFVGLLLGAFATLAVILGSVGIYGVMAFMVNRRMREIGIRMALGASPAAVRNVMMRRGLALTVGGLVLGLAGALAASRGLSTLLFQVSPDDPATLGLTAAVLAATALFACYWPARRAMQVDPMESLRDD